MPSMPFWQLGDDGNAGFDATYCFQCPYVIGRPCVPLYSCGAAVATLPLFGNLAGIKGATFRQRCHFLAMLTAHVGWTSTAAAKQETRFLRETGFLFFYFFTIGMYTLLKSARRMVEPVNGPMRLSLSTIATRQK